MSSERVAGRIAAMGAEFDELLAEPLGGLTTEQRTEALFEWETLMRRQAVMGHRLIAALAEVPVAELGEPTLAAALATLLRISKADAGRRIHEAEDLGPRSALTGEPLEPVLSCTAAAQARGAIGGEHVRIIRRFFDQLNAMPRSGCWTCRRRALGTCRSSRGLWRQRRLWCRMRTSCNDQHGNIDNKAS